MNKQRPAKQEQGYILLLTLIVLVVLLFGVLFVTRGNLLQTVMTGNTLQRQKDVQVGDLALRQIQQAIIQTACGGYPNTCNSLQNTAQGQTWFPMTDAASAMPWTGNFPTQTFWANCQSQQTCDTLAHIQSSVLASVSPKPAVLPGAANILAVVVPASLPQDASPCYLIAPNGASAPADRTPKYYEIFLNIREANGQTGVSTTNVFKLCTVNQP
ncbi:MAG TPA: hypothetical protein PLD03_00495 [Thiomonas arsenitoxydans]|jgi:Tfp pilus assembly protein PilX|uniref:Type IV pilus assembly protein PilX n=1 Tax=Thiomonas intermedia (strain K12) TaxID=75379 RepID=D5X5Y7_THIK1|nr:hypothetical protein [Thiomonas sp.]OZB73280.1 MAG: hypothetical protein B7X36_09975 [Thiomonas sp. 14-64-326]HOI65065.1 hypothetical protein [Thiomonas arsenitoxydans]